MNTHTTSHMSSSFTPCSSLELQGAIRSAWIGAVRAAVASQGLGLHMSAQGELYSSGSGDDATSRPVLGSGRRLLDTYGDSLVYTNRLISREFARCVRWCPVCCSCEGR